MNIGRTLWFTGLSGAGKTTISEKFSQRLIQRGLTVKILDGDIIRREIHADLGFTPEDIKKNNQLICDLCMRFREHYDYILVSIISPFRESRWKAREFIKDNFVEIYVKVTLAKVIERDVKGLYRRALQGTIKNFIGIDPEVPYEEPLAPDIILDTEKDDIGVCIMKLEHFVVQRFGDL